MDAISYGLAAKAVKTIKKLNVVSETEPDRPVLGQEWYVPSSGKLYKRISDGTSEVWVDTNSSGANAAIKRSEEFIVGTASGDYDGTSLNTFPVQAGYYPEYVLVTLNGRVLAKGDFTATDGYTVVLSSDAANTDIVEVLAFGTFAIADHYTKSEVDTVNSAQDSVIAGKALLGGSAAQRFKVADAVNDDEATNKGQLDTAIASAGKVLQVVHVIEQSTASGTGTWKCFEAKITPTKADSKIFVMVQASLVVNQSNDGYAKVMRDGADLLLGTGAGDRRAQMFISGYNGWGGTTTNLMYMDNPATTDEVLYELFALSDTGADAPILLNKRKEDSGGDSGVAISTITLMEIGA